MHKNREIIRLAFDTKLSGRKIATSLSVSRGYVQKCLQKAAEAQLQWPLPGDMDDSALEVLLFPPEVSDCAVVLGEPDWETVHKDLKRKGVNLSLLWHEYSLATSNPLSYSQFCRRYRRYQSGINLVMRQEHLAGEKLFVDYAGDTARVHNADTGEVNLAQIFVCTIGASNYTYAEATWSQESHNWIASHVRAFEFFGGVCEMLVPDNLKVGITKFHRWDPDINPNYHRLAEHYKTSIVPARPIKPKDKAKVEKSVQFAETWILAALRNQIFFSLEDLNAAIKIRVEELNLKPFKKFAGNRLSWFEEIDKPALKSLPEHRYEVEDWSKQTVSNDYHVHYKERFYSVPHALVGEVVFLRVASGIIEIFHKNERIASHALTNLAKPNSTLKEHMPPSHQAQASWTPERILRWAEKIGPATTTLVKKIIDGCKYPQHGVAPTRGILVLEKDYGSVRLENACKRALEIGSTSASSIRSTLKYGLDKTTVQLKIPNSITNDHENIRGPKYFQGELNAEPSNTNEAPRSQTTWHA